MKHIRNLVLLCLIGLFISEKIFAQIHFISVEPTGLPYAVLVNDGEIDGEVLVEGDEIGIFDGDLCVGSAIIPNDFPSTVQVTCWKGSPGQGLAGFAEGNTMIFKVWKSSADYELDLNVDFLDGYGDGNFGTPPYSSVTFSGFTVPGTFALIYPTSSLVLETLSFNLEWYESIDPNPLDNITYEIYLTEEVGVFSDIPDFTTSNTMYEYNGEDLRRYWWKAKAVDDFGNSRWSNQVRSFWIDLPTEPLSFDLLEPAEAETIIASFSVNLEWQEAIEEDRNDSVEYELYISTDQNDLGDAIVVELDDTSFSFTGQNYTQYWWTVHASDNNTEGTWASETRSFVIYNPYPPEDFDLISPTNFSETQDLSMLLEWEESSDVDPGDSFEFVLEWTYNSSYSNSTTVTLPSTTTSYLLENLNDHATIYWRVQAIDTFGLFTWASNSSTGWQFSTNHPDLPSVPSLISPEDLAVSGESSVDFNWSQSTDPDPYDNPRYDFWLATDSEFSNLVTLIENLEITQQTVHFLDDDELFFWKVRATDSNTEGNWSSTRSFTTDYQEAPTAFALASPANGYEFESTDVTLAWSSSSDPDPMDMITYHVDISQTEDFLTFEQFTTQENNFPVDPASLNDNDTYFWRVKAVDSDGLYTCALPEEGWSFIIRDPNAPEAFSLLNPGNESTLESTEFIFAWEATTDPDGGQQIEYNFQISQDQNFDTFESRITTETSYLFSGLNDETTYYWRVLAIDENTNGTFSTETWSFYVDIPQPPGIFCLIAPGNSTTLEVDEVTVSWSESIDPDTDDEIIYQVEWSTSSEFTDFDSATTQDLEYEITDVGGVVLSSLMNVINEQQRSSTNELDELPDDSIIYWRVKATDTDGNEVYANPGQSGWSFSIYIPDAPSGFNLTSPEHESVSLDGTALLTWDAPDEVDPGDILTYEVHISHDENMENGVLILNSETTELELVELVDDSIYYWTVKAIDTNTEGTFADEIWSFSVNIPEEPGLFAMLEPLNEIEVTNSSVTFTWTESIDPDPGDEIAYRLEYSINEDFTNSLSGVTADTFLTLNDFLDETIYYWRVIAADNDGNEVYANPGENGFSFSVNIAEAPVDFATISPVNETELDTLTYEFIWEASIDPDANDQIIYFLHISLAEDFESDSLAIYEAGEDTSFIVPYLADESSYWWRVLAQDTNTAGTLSDVRTFTTNWRQPPEPFSLISMGEDPLHWEDEITFSWTEAVDPDTDDIVTYQLEVADNDEFLDPIHVETGISELSTTHTFDVQGGFYWRVIASDTDGHQTISEESLEFFLPVEEDNESFPTEFALTKIYPNPFNSTFRVSFDVPQQNQLILRLFDILGREVELLSSSVYEAGSHEIICDPKISSGVYFITIQNESGWKATRKVVFIQ